MRFTHAHTHTHTTPDRSSLTLQDSYLPSLLIFTPRLSLICPTADCPASTHTPPASHIHTLDTLVRAESFFSLMLLCVVQLHSNDRHCYTNVVATSQAWPVAPSRQSHVPVSKLQSPWLEHTVDSSYTVFDCNSSNGSKVDQQARHASNRTVGGELQDDYMPNACVATHRHHQHHHQCSQFARPVASIIQNKVRDRPPKHAHAKNARASPSRLPPPAACRSGRQAQCNNPVQLTSKANAPGPTQVPAHPPL
jgi:hypothetical protein